MNKVIMTLIYLAFFLVICGCKKERAACPVSEILASNDGNIALLSDERIVQSIKWSGIANTSVYVSGVKLYMSSDNLSEVKLDIREVASCCFADDGKLLGSSTVTTELGSPSATNETDFIFSPPVRLTVGESYSFILEGIGGSYKVSVANPKLFSTGDIQIDSRREVGELDKLGLSVVFTFSSCEGL